MNCIIRSHSDSNYKHFQLHADQLVNNIDSCTTQFDFQKARKTGHSRVCCQEPLISLGIYYSMTSDVEKL